MPETASQPTVTRTATVILAVIACGATLYWLRSILTPLALAVFLAVMIDGFARVIRSRLPWVSERTALPAAIVLSVLLFGGSTFVIAENATSFVGQLVAYTPRLNGLIAQVAGLLGIDVPPTVSELFVRLNPSAYLADVAKGLQGFASDAFFILIYLGFIIASRRGFQRKVVGLFPHHAERTEAMAAFRRIRDGVERYLWVQTVTGLIIAVASWIAMAVMGLDNAIFWAFLIFIASYIPVIGGAVGILAPPIFALIQFPTFWPAVILLGVLQAIQFVVGNIILPRMQGDSLNMDPVVVLLSLAFWGALWGMAGMFLSTPLTVMAMVILAQFRGTRWLAVLLSADGEPEKLRDHRSSGAPDKKPALEKRTSASRKREPIS
ncbi:AI-2E family transporter [Phenylobacterium sp. LH3H17]|uniref:AI-2E family transporter n=1 Tax=Phenylobacterium sp. LH3H17 TaxID=2903901 RepID=UPI0020CA24CD|nr:AI-2E family transporter [Phenylobacterium sp. LH3H17]UTP39730.1 AI-2E family transporter [Phenylobacterium sp. LH3H17]